MRWILGLLFLSILELGLLLVSAELVGSDLTLGLVVVSGVAGLIIIREQGPSAWTFYLDENRRERLPVQTVLDAGLTAVAGAFLLTPGFVTDLMGISLLIAPLRRWTSETLTATMERWAR